MVITCEISLYPLLENYEEVIINVIKTLKRCDGLQVNTHAMSTFIKGESSNVFSAMDMVYQLDAMQSKPSALVMKVINKDLPVEVGFLKFA